jgi:predicted ATPase with chaperone activity
MDVSNLSDWTPNTGVPVQTDPRVSEAARDGHPQATAAQQVGFFPDEPVTREQTGLSSAEIESLILKLLLNCGSGTGREISHHIRLPFAIIKGEMLALKTQLLVSYRDGAPMNDYEYVLTDLGIVRARQRADVCTYFGAAPVCMEAYIEAIKKQSIENATPRLADLQRAFADLQLPPAVISQIGQAVNAGRSLFLYGAPGNGKTCIAERIIRAVSEYIWIPKCITITDEIIRLFDPSVHDEVPLVDQSNDDKLLESLKIDRRWVRIRRPTIITGGELTLDMLECKLNPATGINEAPLQLKSNGGALIIDDFGRQQMSTTELLNRWIIPLEKGYDYLSLRSGRHLEVPFAQLLVFSTNLDPRDIVDEAFLRRIPYKIEVFDPTEDEFRKLFVNLARKMEFAFSEKIVDYLLEKHYRQQKRPLRYCHARDLLLQVKNLNEFHELPMEVTETAIDVAAYNYFAGLSGDHA